MLRHEREVGRYRDRHPGIRVGGTWWVAPGTAGLHKTTRALGDAGSASLWLTEDEVGWESADLMPCTIDPTARVVEIASPSDWARLVQAYPLDVTQSRRPDWYESLDPHDGGWLIPDWSAVARDYEGVHVSVLAWLMTSGQAVPAGPRATTTMAGWDPDATWWLADVVRPAGTAHRWLRRDEAWVPGSRARTTGF